MSKFIQWLFALFFLSWILSADGVARSLEAEPAHFYENFVSMVNSQTPQKQLSLMNYLLITDYIRPDLDKIEVIRCLDNLAESSSSPTVRNHAQLVRLILNSTESSEIPESIIQSNNKDTKNATLIFLKYINENFFNNGNHDAGLSQYNQ